MKMRGAGPRPATPIGQDRIGAPPNIAQKIKTLLEFHEQEGTIDNKLRTFLTKTDPITPIFYLLPKIHKQLFKPPGRPVVSLTDSILSPPAIVLEKILTPLVKATSSFILDTNDFLGLIRALDTIPSSSLPVTWDVSSLYTSITHEKGILAVDRLLNEAGTHIKIRRFCTDLLNLVLRDNYFMFEDTFYIQQQGTAMGSHVAPPYAIACMSSFEKNFVYTHPLFQTHSRIWRRYIDDIFCIWDGPIDSLISFDKHLNVWPELKFTLQYNMDRISFLDILICKKDGGELPIDLFLKPTDRNSLLHYNSCHPPSIKNAIPKSQFQRINRIVSDETTKNTRLNEMQQKFSNRGYPQKTLLQAKHTSVSNKANDNNKRIPFVSTFT
ncbi:unnamed protein product [Ranitomeya imitator]|uniref:Helix-turn-helix domain-containing protein n=1 Tax=Ranitomeya imitator TaxID=111125 RepID=A0ABN9LWL6_9NEOB|nr:unnamed protein product [Ranitomeya imitator]